MRSGVSTSALQVKVTDKVFCSNIGRKLAMAKGIFKEARGD